MLLGMIFYPQTSLYAQNFRTRSYKYPIGKVLKTNGKAVALGNFDRTLQYLTRGDEISNQLKITTREDSGLTLQIGPQSILLFGENTNATIHYLQSEGITLIRLAQGTIRYKYNTTGTPDVFITGRTKASYYSARRFDAVSQRDRFYFRKTSRSKVYRFNRVNIGKENRLQIGDKDLELLTENYNNKEATFHIKKGSVQKKPKKKAKKEDAGLADASSIFGDSSSGGGAFDDIFGSGTSSNLEQASDIFGSDVSVKSRSERAKLKDNIGLQLQKEAPPLPKVTIQDADKEIGPFDISLFSKSTFYTQSPRQDVGSIDTQGFHQDIRVTLGNKINISDSESLSINGWLEGSNRKDVYNDFGDTLDFRSSKRNYAYLNEFYYTYSTSDFDIQFGKKIVKAGKGIIYSPSDSFSATDVTIPTAPIYLGNVIVSLDYYFGEWTLSTIFFPTIVPNKSPAQNSRWTTLYSNTDYNLEQDIPSGIGPKTKQVFIKLEGTYWGTDWMFTLFNGPNSNPVIRNDIEVTDNVPEFTLVQEYVPITFISMGFSTTMLGFEFHGEILNQNAEDGKDDSFTSFMLGTRYTMDTFPKYFGFNSIDIIIEHGRESLRSAQSRPFYALSSIGSRLYQNSLLGTIIFNYSDELSFNYDFHYDRKNDGSAEIYGVNYNSGTSQWRFKFESFQGSEASNFGLWDLNDNYTLEYSYTF